MPRTAYHLEVASLNIETVVALKEITEETFQDEFEEFKGCRISPLTYVTGGVDLIVNVENSEMREDPKYKAKVSFRFYVEKDGTIRRVYHSIAEITLSRPNEKLTDQVSNPVKSAASLIVEFLRLAIQILVDRAEY